MGLDILVAQVAEAAAEGPAILEALRLIGRLQEENRDLAGQLGYVRAQLAAAEDRVRALEAPASQDAPGSAGSGPDPLATSTPWYRRWWTWMILL